MILIKGIEKEIRKMIDDLGSAMVLVPYFHGMLENIRKLISACMRSIAL